VSSERSSANRGWRVLALVTLVVVAVTLAVVFTRPPAERTLRSLPEGISPRSVRGVPVFVLRQGREVQVFLDRVPHLPNERLWWCLTERVFVSPFHGELFDGRGQRLAGPAAGTLTGFGSR
jgi:hypothetical protein